MDYHLCSTKNCYKNRMLCNSVTVFLCYMNNNPLLNNLYMYVKVVRYVRKWARSVLQTDQLTVAVCVRLQLQSIEGESKGMTQTCKGAVLHARSRAHKDSGQILLPQTTKGMATQIDDL